MVSIYIFITFDIPFYRVRLMIFILNYEEDDPDFQDDRYADGIKSTTEACSYPDGLMIMEYMNTFLRQTENYKMYKSKPD